MIKVAAIGTEGYACEQLERIVSLNHRFELVGVCSQPFRRQKGYQLCQNRGIPIYDTADALIEGVRGNAEAMFIFTGIDSHYQYTLKCLNAGFEVFLEKPPVPTIQQLDALVALEKIVNKRIAVLFQYLYSPIVQVLKHRIVSGEFGNVIRVRSLATWQRPDAYFTRGAWSGVVKTAGGEWVLDGTLNNPLAHVLSNSLYLAGMKAGQMATPVMVQAELYRVHDIESEDTSSVRIVCDNGCVIMNNTTLCSETEVRSETVIECRQAVIHYQDFNSAHIIYEDGRNDEILSNVGDQRLYMLNDLADSYQSGLPYKVPLAICRPFTLCVNGAFDSSGKASPIGSEHITRESNNGIPMTLIKDIAPIMRKAHSRSQLLSEISVPWAKSGQPVSMKEYNHFPSHPL